jgi:Ca2+-binding EF-hand superfamily protein
MDRPEATQPSTSEKPADSGQAGADKKAMSPEDRQRLRAEKEKENEVADAFAYFDRKRQGKLPISSLEEVVSMLGITLPPGDKRTPLLKIADPSGRPR